jgi:hypothetical protein
MVRLMNDVFRNLVRSVRLRERLNEGRGVKEREVTLKVLCTSTLKLRELTEVYLWHELV